MEEIEVTFKTLKTTCKAIELDSSAGYHLLKLCATHTVVTPDGSSLLFNNEQDARNYYDSKIS